MYIYMCVFNYVHMHIVYVYIYRHMYTIVPTHRTLFSFICLFQKFHLEGVGRDHPADLLLLAPSHNFAAALSISRKCS